MAWDYQLDIDRYYPSVRTYLTEQLNLPKHLVYLLRSNQRVLVNHQYRPMNFPIKPGETVNISFNQTDFSTSAFPMLPDWTRSLEVLWESDDLMVVNKPRGLKTHPNQPGELGTVFNLAAAYLAPKRPLMVHRLDQQTSGALIIAKVPPVIAILTKMLKTKTLQRTYLAWVRGMLPHPQGTINQPIGKDPFDQRKRQINGQNPQPAITHYQLLKTNENASLLKITLETGRTHQIRVHFASLGHPIVNDPLYDHLATSRQPMLLHSWRIAFKTPYYNQAVVVISPLPPEFKRFS
ncbi:RluA family pseudouridine synthase [Fructilactobacillus florum]|uniref:Pseudouridine synthase n=1 Tax=Fructilactobacillus florum DSM 22689 = JCM 16035 TaxID=1423745 RepID=A0A0R2CDU0_9LACO|nr:RluA family pseudouridine synthase [Fructilactobacillus florum]KRM89864.1 hypothetical protein FC87_GL000279 [Fructilactobacillus florum DSM 22689 = JCM 16035]